MWLGKYYISTDIAAIVIAIIVLLFMQYTGITLPYVSVRELLFLAIILLVVKAVYPAGARLLMFLIILLLLIRVFFSLSFLPLLVLLLLIVLLLGFIR